MTAPASPAAHTSDGELPCPRCGYDLRGIASDRCPECGATVDRTLLAASRLPWARGGERGIAARARAYVRTVWMVVRRPSLVGAEAARPVDYAAAVRFRWTTVAIVMLTLLATVVAAWWADAIDEFVKSIDLSGPFADILFGSRGKRYQPSVRQLDVLLPIAAGWLAWALAPLYVLLAVAGWTGVASYAFRPRRLSVERQNRAFALAQYACAPLALLLPAAVLAGAAALLAGDDPDPGTAVKAVVLALKCCASGLLIVILGSSWLGTLRVLKAATQAGTGRQLATAILVPIGWLLVAALALGVVPWCVGFFSLVRASFR